MHSSLYYQILTLESEEFPAADGAETLVELEHTWYGRLTDRTILDSAASVEKQEQWTVRAKPGDACKYGGSIRVRQSQRGSDTSYMLCIKAFESGKRGCLENEFEVNDTTFEQFRRIAESGMIKTRYTFPIANTDYAFEVDVYDGTDWVKIDLEIDNPQFVIPDLPIPLEGCFRDSQHNRTDAQQKLVDELMERYFCRKNSYSA
jgi:hypothetical protein